MQNIYIPLTFQKIMQKKVLMLVILLLLISSVLAQEDIYSMNSLDLKLKVDDSFELVPTKSGASIKEASANLLLYPKESERQKIIQFTSEGVAQEDMISFVWKEKKIESKEYGYTAVIETQNKRLPVKDKISFPLATSEVQGLEQYLQPTETIDSNNPAVIAKAAELAEGEDRSEEHTSELQSQFHLVCRPLLEKKK